MNFNTILGTVKRNFQIKMRAYPFTFFFGNLLTAIYSVLGAYFIFKLLFNSQVSKSFKTYTSIDDYMSYIIIGTTIYMFVVRTILNVSRSYITEIRTGTLNSILITPMKHSDYLIGHMIEQTILTTIEFFIALILTIPFGLKLGNIHISTTLLIVLLVLFSFYGISILIAALMIYLKDTYISQNTIFIFIALTCGVSFPIEYLPKWLQFFSNISPISHALKLLRDSLLLGKDFSSQKYEILVLFILGIVYLILGQLWIDRILKNAAENQFV